MTKGLFWPAPNQKYHRDYHHTSTSIIDQSEKFVRLIPSFMTISIDFFYKDNATIDSKQIY